MFSDILFVLKHCLCELSFYLLLQDLIYLIFLLLLKNTSPIRLVLLLPHSNDSIRVANFHVERGPQVAL